MNSEKYRFEVVNSAQTPSKTPEKPFHEKTAYGKFKINS